jgi:TrmH family RNA methyltransferase
VVLDGEHLVREAMRAGLTIEGVLINGRHETLARDVDALGIPCYAGTSAVLAAASPVRAPSGVVAIAEWTPMTPARLLSAHGTVVVGLVDVQDPGNVGSAIRSADALGASGVLALGASADPGGWKALRGAMGSTFRLPVGRGDVEQALASAAANGVAVLATVARGGAPLDRLALAPPLLVLVGNEGAGLPEDVVARAAQQIHIPMRAGVESLNVAVSATLVVWELRRRGESVRERARA